MFSFRGRKSDAGNSVGNEKKVRFDDQNKDTRAKDETESANVFRERSRSRNRTPATSKTAESCLEDASKCNFDDEKDERTKLFEKEYRDSHFSITTAREGEVNILHFYITGVRDLGFMRAWEIEARKKFLKWVLRKYGKLFTHQPSENGKKNPLHLALHNGNDELVETVLDHFDQELSSHANDPSSHVNIAETKSMLTQTDSEQQTCLHMAVIKNPKYAEPLINLYGRLKIAMEPNDTPFEKRDLAKHTPLHSAVQAVNYKITVAVKGGDKHLKVVVETEKGYKQQDKQILVVRKLVGAHKSSLKRLPTSTKDSPESSTPYEIREVSIQKAIDEAWHEERERLSKELTEGTLQASEQALSSQLKVEARRVHIDDPILELIRLEVLRTSEWDRKTMIECLYPPGKERHIEFSLAGFPRPTLSEDYLEKLAKHLSFESVLASVHLPALRVESQWGHTPEANGRHDSLLAAKKLSLSRGKIGTDDAAVGIDDFIVIFDWLRKQQVKKIIKIVVVDDRDPPHSDEAIETALRDFDVEIWDWKRLDVCSDVIQQVSSKIRDVSLYWSGNNATLMGWASEDGFRNGGKFPKLTSVRVHYKKGLEDSDRRKGYLENFKEKITGNSVANNGDATDGAINMLSEEWHHIPDAGTGGVQQKPQTVRKIECDYKAVRTFMSELASAFGNKSSNKWLSSMDEIVKVIRSVPMDEIPPVKIAIIDDGVDASLDKFDGKIAAGSSFSSQYGQDNSNLYFVSSSHHGTMMASLILDLCPRAKLYVAKLEERLSSRGSRHITPKSAAEAVRWAVGCDVDIISMSWSIESSDTPEHNEGLKRLEEEIDVAAKRGKNTKDATGPILMFCAASDQGASTKISCYPALWGKCIRIGAATSTGEKLAWVGDDIDFLLPGENISFTPSDDEPAINKPGSSIATALASGYAGLMLYLERLYQAKAKPGMKIYKSIQDKRQMEIALRQLAIPTSNGKFFLGPDRFRGFLSKNWSIRKDRDDIIESLNHMFRSIIYMNTPRRSRPEAGHP